MKTTNLLKPIGLAVAAKLILFCVFAFIGSSIQAEGWGEIRFCSNGVSWSYKAVAKVRCKPASTKTHTSQSCNSLREAYTEHRNLWGNRIAWQKTRFGPSFFESTGALHRNNCSRGCNNDFASYLSLFNFDDPEEEETDSIWENHEITSSGVDYDTVNNKITIGNIEGFDEVNTDEFALNFKIIIWEPDDENDSIINALKIKWEGWVSYVAGVITYYNFDSTEISATTVSNMHTLSFNGFDKVITFSNTEDITQYAVRIISHAEDHILGPAVASLSSTQEHIKSNKISFNVFPNPSNDVLNISFFDYDNPNSEAVLKIFNSQGAEVINKSYKFENNQIDNYTISVSDLSQGIYYVSITSNNKVYVLKFQKT